MHFRTVAVNLAPLSNSAPNSKSKQCGCDYVTAQARFPSIVQPRHVGTFQPTPPSRHSTISLKRRPRRPPPPPEPRSYPYETHTQKTVTDIHGPGFEIADIRAQESKQGHTVDILEKRTPRQKLQQRNHESGRRQTQERCSK